MKIPISWTHIRKFLVGNSSKITYEQKLFVGQLRGRPYPVSNPIVCIHDLSIHLLVLVPPKLPFILDTIHIFIFMDE